MRKLFSVFFLSAILIFSTALSGNAALKEIPVTSNSDIWNSETRTLNITENALYTFNTFRDVIIDVVSVDENVTEAEIVLPTPTIDIPSYGTYGKWRFEFGDREGKSILHLNVTKGSTNSAIIFAGSTWNIPRSVDLVIDAPLRVNDASKGFVAEAIINPGGKLTLGTWAEIFTNPENPNHANGFYNRADDGEGHDYKSAGTSFMGFNIKSDDDFTGELVFQSITAAKGPGLYVTGNGILTFDIPGMPIFDIEGATYNFDGKINVIRDLTLVNTGPVKGSASYYGVFYAQNADTDGTATFTKTGPAKLTLKHNGLVKDDNENAYWYSETGKEISAINVNAGKLVFDCDGNASYPVWKREYRNDWTNHLVLNVYDGANFEAYPLSIAVANVFVINVYETGSVSFGTHAVTDGSGNEIYPYEDYKTYNNAMNIGISPTLNIVDADSKAIINGIQAFGSIFGTGTIEINSPSNGAKLDDGVLILTTSTADFTGKITGSHANIGFYSINYNGNKTFDCGILDKADVTLDNLIVYGGNAILEISGDSNLFNVGNIWLRSNRPGANNRSAATANADLRIGSLKTADNSSIVLSGLRIDGTSGTYEYWRGLVQAGVNSNLFLSNIELYANKGVSRDFEIAYKTRDTINTNGIYALTLDGSARSSKITIDGNTLTGDGLRGDVAAKNYQVQIMARSDVKFTGENDYYPLAHNNSLYVEQDAKVEFSSGAIIDGNLAFEGSTINANEIEFGSENYPSEAWFINDDERLNSYSVLTAHAGRKNRMTNADGEEYSLRVNGDVDSSNTLLRVKLKVDAFDGSEFTTIGQRFKILEAENEIANNFPIVYNPVCNFRIPANSDTTNLIVENRNELVLANLGSWSFLKGGETFGDGTSNFEIEIPLTFTLRGQNYTLVFEDGNYYLQNESGSEKFNVDDMKVFFVINNYDDSELTVDKLQGRTSYTDIIINTDIIMTAEIDSEKQSIRLIGISYSGENPVNVTIAFTANCQNDYIGGLFPAARSYTLVRQGIILPGTQWSNAKTEAVDETDFTVGESATVKFYVDSVRKATYATASVPVYTDNGYVWNDGTITTDYFMPDANGKETKVKEIDVVLFDGDYLSRNTKSSDITSFELISEGSGVIVSLPLSALGNTGTAFNAIKGLSLKGTTENGGKIITVPVNFSLHAAISPNDIIPATTLNNTVVVNGDPVSGVYDIPEDVLSGDIHLLGYNLPEWLGFYGNGSTISYETKDLSNVEPGTYNFSVLAYVGENALTSKHKLYTFSVTVVALHLEVPMITTMIIPKEGRVRVRVVGDYDNQVRNWTVTAIDGAPKFAAMSGKVTGNGTIELKLATADLAEGTYNYAIAVGTLKAEFTVIVKKPGFAIIEVSNNFDDAIEGRTYTAIFQVVGYEGEIAWSFDSEDVTSNLYTLNVGDMFIVEGIARRNYDETEDEDIEQIFSVSVTDTVHGEAEPVEVEFIVEPEDEDIIFTTDGLIFTGDNNAVKDGYEVRFPSGVVADIDNVYIPSWLEPIFNADDEVIGVKFVKPSGNLQNGTKATVRILFAYDDENEYNYGWGVVYGEDTETTPLVVTHNINAFFDNNTGRLDYGNGFANDIFFGGIGFELDKEFESLDTSAKDDSKTALAMTAKHFTNNTRGFSLRNNKLFIARNTVNSSNKLLTKSLNDIADKANKRVKDAFIIGAGNDSYWYSAGGRYEVGANKEGKFDLLNQEASYIPAKFPDDKNDEYYYTFNFWGQNEGLSFNGRKISWNNLESIPNGSRNINEIRSTADVLEDIVPYFEFREKGEDPEIKNIKWRFVNDKDNPDNAVILNFDTVIVLYVNHKRNNLNHGQYNPEINYAFINAGEIAQGEMTLKTPIKVSDIGNITLFFDRGGIRYAWNVNNSLPNIYNDELPDGKVGVSYEEQLDIGGRGEIWDVDVNYNDAPFEIKINEDNDGTYKIVCTPTKSGEFTFSIQARNESGYDEKEFVLKVAPSKAIKPAIKTSKVDKGKVDREYNFEFALKNYTPVTWSILGLPDELGLEFDTEEGNLTGWPERVYKGKITVTATNASGSSTKKYDLIIDGEAPEIETLPEDIPLSLATGKEYEFNFYPDGTPQIPTVSLSYSGKIPSGMKMTRDDDGTGYVLSGIPDKAGNYNLTITASDVLGRKPKKTYKFTVAESLKIITEDNLKAGTAKKSYSVSFKYKGPKNVTWSIVSGNIPTGMTFSKGKLKGKPVSSGNYTFTIRLTAGNDSTEKTFHLKISGIPPKIKTSSLKANISGYKEGSLKLTASAGSNPIYWSIIGNNQLPANLALESDGTITGKPITDFNGSITVQASNDAGKVSKTIKLTIKGVKPKFSKIGQQEVSTSDEIGKTVIDVSKYLVAGTDPIKYNLTTSPNWLTISDGGVISLKATPVYNKKAITVKVKATNNTGSANVSFKLKVIQDK